MSTANMQATRSRADKAPSKGMVTLGRLLGAIGVVLLLSTPFTYLIAGEMGVLVWVKLLFTSLCFAVYVLTNPDFFTRMAGARSTGMMSMTIASVVVVIGILGALNYFAIKNPKDFDLTREGIYTLSQQTTELLGRLRQPVKIYAFYAPGDPAAAPLEDTLKRYRAFSEQLTYEVVNPNNRPDLIEKYTITDAGPRIVVTAGANDARAKSDSEEELTNAILSVTQGAKKIVYVLSGHDELGLDDEKGLQQAAELARAEGYDVKDLSFLKSGSAPRPGEAVKVDLEAAKQGAVQPAADAKFEVPRDAAVLLVPGPKGALFEAEQKALEEYLGRGGRVVLMLDPDSDGGLSGLTRQWKLAPRNDLVVDAAAPTQLGAAAPLVWASETHAATRDVGAPLIFIVSRSIELLEGGEAGVQAQALFSGGETAWGESAYKEGTAGLDEKDTKAPVVVGAVATRPTNAIDAKLTPEGRLVVIGDSEWVSAKVVRQAGNTDAFLNLLAWLAEEESKITIRPKTRTASSVILTDDQFGRLVFFSMDILPVFVFALGFGVVLVRRQR